MAGDTSPPLDDAARPLLEVRGLVVEGTSGGRSQTIVRGIDLTVRRGEVVGLIGESGAGKSTLGLAAIGFVRPGCRITGGELRFDGIDLFALSEAERQRFRGTRVAYVAQSAAAAFNPAHRLIDQTIESAVLWGRRDPVEARAAAIDLYRRLMLPDPEHIGDRFPHQVSGGQLQRVMTAMAMLARPDLIVFDEPTTALDVTTQVEVITSIRDVVRDFGMAALYITHDLAVVAQLADRILVLRHGAAVEEAPTRTMLAAPREPYTRSLWAVRDLVAPEKPSRPALLTVEGIEAAYGTVPVLSDVAITVPRGATVAVVGESGSGKSTLARVVTGLLPPLRGRVVFDGHTLPPGLAQRSSEHLRRIQLVHQSADTSLNPRHSVRRLIGRPLELYAGLRGGDRDRRVLELLEMIEMSATHLDRLPGALSGGQKQRIAIARALATAPDLMICDEITSALDQVVQQEILKLLMRLQQELRISYLFITHDIATVRAIADEVVVMHRGRVVERGGKTSVLSHPERAYTRDLLACVPQIDPDWLDRHIEARALREG